MRVARKENLSLYYLVSSILADAPGLTIVDSFPDKLINLPTVSIDADLMSLELYELGSRDRIRTRTWFIDIFAKNKQQREDFAFELVEELEDGVSVYDYDEGFPPSVSPTKIGHLGVMSLRYKPVRIMPELVETMYYRGTVTLVASNDTV